MLASLGQDHHKKTSQSLTLKKAIDETYEKRWQHNKDWKTPLERAGIIMEILGESITLAEIDDGKVDKLVDNLLNTRKLTKATVNRYLATLSVIYTVNKEKHNRPEINKFKETKGRIRYLTKEEETKMLKYLKDTNRQDIAEFYVCLIDTGARFSEMNTLLKQDVLLDSKEIHIWENKGDLPRTIPLTKRAKKILEQRKTENNKVWNLKYQEVYDVFQEVKRYLNLDHDNDFTIHTFRHTFASRLVQRGVSLYTVQRLLGHYSIQVTEKYAHLNTENLREAVELLED